MATGNDGSQSMGGSAPPTYNFARTFKYLMGYFVILNSCNLSCTKIIIGLNCFPAFFVSLHVQQHSSYRGWSPLYSMHG